MSILDPVDGVNQNLAIEYLDAIFGKMSDSLPFDSSVQFLGPIFEMFNMVALTAGVILVIYHVLVGTFRTANDGKVLGDRESPGMRIIQMLASIVLLIPTTTGYCLAQILFMHIVVLGVYAADNIWNRALEVLVPETTQSTVMWNDVNSDEEKDQFDLEYRIQFRTNLQTIVEGIMCARSVHYNTGNQILPIRDPSGKMLRIEFGDSIDGNFTPPCGYVDVSAFTPTQQTALYNWMHKFLEQLPGDNGKCLRDGRDCAASGKDLNYWFIDLIRSGDEHIGYYPNHSYWLDDLIDVFQGGTIPTVKQSNVASSCDGSADSDACLVDRMMEKGWILAGSYYRVVYQMVAALHEGSFAPTAQIKDYSLYAQHSDSVSRATMYWQYFSAGDDIWWCQKRGSEECDTQSPLFGSYSNMRGATDALGEETKRIGIKSALDISIIDFFNVLDTGTTDVIAIKDPFTKLVQYGYKLMHKGRIIIQNITWANVALTGTTLLTRGFPHSKRGALAAEVMGSLQSALTAITPFAYAIAGIFYTLGGVLAIYLPMIPLVIFIIASIGWLISVVESMVAAPLVAIGIIWPDTQPHVLGRAETAVMMLLNLFLRPTLIIIGFLAAISMAWVSLSILNMGFLSMMEYGGLMIEDLLGPLVLQAFYVGLVYVIIDNAFSLITVVPDKVLYWIGDKSQGQGNADKALSGAKNQGETGMSGGLRAADGLGNAPQGISAGAKSGSQAVRDYTGQKKTEGNGVNVTY